MKVGVLTSSRADFGIYLPLLKAMSLDPFFDVRLIVFGTHLSSFHGYTIKDIQAENFVIDECVETVVGSDSPSSIATSMAITAMKFAQVWEKNKYDLVFCLGDRYEMFSAVSAAAPFEVSFAHIHGGETTLGAIDNQFRHCLTVFSKLHFVANDTFAERVKQITGFGNHIYAVGALSLDNLNDLKLLNLPDFERKFGIDLSIPTILVTYHPETVAISSNERNAQELILALKYFKKYQLVITMPNADTKGNLLRNAYLEFSFNKDNVHVIENFGTQGYFTCMKYCELILGNSSSGIIEAASFNKYVVNIGDRQKGRLTGDNVIHCRAEAKSIIAACEKGLAAQLYHGSNLYYKGGAANKIIQALKKWEH